MKYFYVILSQTQTNFAKVIRKVGKQNYNHCSICMDSEFKDIYAFARPQHNAVLLGGLVRESFERFTLSRDIDVPISVYKIPITDEKYAELEATIAKMLNNRKYMYNLFSVLTQPITKGFPVENAFSCVEFVVHILQMNGLLLEKKRYHYKPDDLHEILAEYLVYEGDIRSQIPEYDFSDYDDYHQYDAPFTAALFALSAVALVRILKRTAVNRKE